MAAAARFYTVLIVFLAVSHVAFTLRFKIAIPEEGREALRHRLTKRRSEVCKNYRVEESAQKLQYSDAYDDEYLKKPWEKIERTVVYSSPEVTKGMEDMFKLQVPGLEGATIGEVLDHLHEEAGCLCFPYGECIRDQFLEETPKGLDVETNCDHQRFNQMCVEKWGAPNCKSDGKTEHIGSMANNDIGRTDIIDVENWEETFFGVGTDLEYTTNSIAYFARGKNIVIDLTGTGVSDTCGKLIRIPVDGKLRVAWHSDIKIFSYWKLRVEEYKEADQETLDYIKEQVVDMMDKREDEFKKYYCKYALLGDMDATCEIPIKSCPNIKKQAFDRVFSEDLQGHWDETGKGLVNKLECDSCPHLPGC